MWGILACREAVRWGKAIVVDEHIFELGVPVDEEWK
jgi:hypothetical protein